MKYHRSVIIITLHRLGYLVHSLDNRAMTLSTETSKIVLSILKFIVSSLENAHRV